MASFADFAASGFEPVGVVRVLSAPLPASVAWLLWAASVLCAAATALGWRHRVTGPLFAFLLLWVTSYRTSWGMVFHTDNLLVFHGLVVGLCPSAADALSLDARAKPAAAPSVHHGWPLRLMCWIVVISYVIAGLAKVRLSGLHWGSGEILRNYIAYDTVRKLQVGSVISPLGAWLVQYEAPFRVIGLATLVLEIGAPLAMLGGVVRRVFVLGLWGFHWGVLAVMAIAFVYPLSGVAYAAFFASERLWRLRPLRPIARALAPNATLV